MTSMFSFSGIGLSLADRLLSEYPTIHLCLACRNTDRAKLAKTKLLHRHNGADISILTVDTSSVESVLQAAEQIMERYKTPCRCQFVIISQIWSTKSNMGHDKKQIAFEHVQNHSYR